MGMQRCPWDGFEYDSESPEGFVHQQLDELVKQLRTGHHSPRNTKPKDLPAGAELLSQPPSELANLTIAVAQRLQKTGKSWQIRTFMGVFLKYLMGRKLHWDNAKLERLLAALAGLSGKSETIPWNLLAKQLERFDEEQGLTESHSGHIPAIVGKVPTESASLRQISQRLGAVIGETSLLIEPGEAWADVALAELGAMSKQQRAAWGELIALALGASASKPTKQWRQQATQYVGSLGAKDFAERAVRWFALADKPRNDTLPPSTWRPDPNLMLTDSSATMLKGLAWSCAGVEHPELARALTGLAISAYRKVPGIGPRWVKLGNACVWALGEMPGHEGVGQLALLRAKVKFGTAQKGIDKALHATSERLGIAADELEEMGVPTFGLTEIGKQTRMLGDYRAEITVSGSRASLAWFRPSGDGFRQQKTVPAVVRKEYAAELKELRAAAKDIRKMLAVQRGRADSLFLAQRRWPLAVWRQRYLDHFLLGVMARCLIWRFHDTGSSQDGIYHEGQLMDCHGEPLAELSPDTEVELWHPLATSTDEVMAWRRWLESQQVVQPFKQAHREVYLLTDAERNTGTYSNRFAAHVIKQHQFNALCGARGWKNTLRLMVDDSYPPATRELAGWNLRAEYWVEGIGGDFGIDTSDAGAYLRLATDQVRFYRLDAPVHWSHALVGGYETEHGQADGQVDQPVRLEEVPPLVLSEVMRDVDLFVGVASVGNDPTWQDGGPDGAYRSYWYNYSFGELSATARTRHDILERLLPRLKIADRCALDGRFLRVRGDLRSYKIHLGSSNILMEPDDQYLCIVLDSGAVAGPASKVFLPFEGDRTLSMVLSKAFLLAADTKIKDPTIVSQIQR